jgi:hypothetical protein
VNHHHRRHTRRHARLTRPTAAACLLALFILCCPPPHVSAYPQPAAVPRAWQFDFTFRQPEPIAFTDLNGRTSWYWYMTYKLVNRTGRERIFIPEITIATDAGDIITAGRDVPPQVLDAIRTRLGNDLIEAPAQMIGRTILQGEDHAGESVAIWRHFDHDVDHMSIFIEGLSGETTRIDHPLTAEPVLMRKTLMLEYALPGRPPSPRQQQVVPLGEQWIMR